MDRIITGTMKSILQKILLIILLISIAGLSKAYTQSPPNEEKIFLHYSSSLLFPGEYLYFKLYCLDRTIGKPTNISTIAYVELIGEDRKPVLHRKINLENGLGHADFFIPNEIRSGNYKLIAYTQWMRNFEPNRFFEADITILNPYLADQGGLLTNNNLPGGPVTDSNSVTTTLKRPQNNEWNNFEINLNKSNFGRREEVVLEVKNRMREVGIGSYSISVRKIDELPSHPLFSAKMHEFHLDLKIRNGSTTTGQHETFKAETNGFILSGKLISTDPRQHVAGKDVVLSVPGDNFIFKAERTNGKGEFQFDIASNIEPEDAVLMMLEDTDNKYKFELLPREPLMYSDVEFTDYNLVPSMKESIEKRSVNNQIENGYFSIKPDTVKAELPAKPFAYYEKWTKYDLDDYTRFATMEEVFTEIIKLVWTENNDEGKLVVRVFNRKFTPETDDLPLIFIDGLFIPDHDEVLGLNANRVQNIYVSQKPYQFGDTDYQGVLKIETINGDYMNHSGLNERQLSFNLDKPEPRKSYFRQSYYPQDFELSNRIPDYRKQLLWAPNVDIRSSSWSNTFFTSDNKGIYEVRLEGYTEKGIPVSVKKQFTVGSVN